MVVDGSFVTNKRYPNDYDAAWDPQHVDPNLVDPVLLTFDDQRKAMKAKYRGELFPDTWSAEPNVSFIDFFQRDRAGQPKGIIRLDLKGLP